MGANGVDCKVLGGKRSVNCEEDVLMNVSAEPHFRTHGIKKADYEQVSFDDEE